MEDWTNKNVLVLGLAKSGLSVTNLLLDLDCHIIVNDARPLANDPKAQELRDKGIHVIGGGHPEYLVTEQTDYLIKNPGIPYTNPLVQKAMSLKIPVITEIELASQLLKPEFLGVTGSNGKTTTSTLIADMLRHDQRKGDIYLVGNIGIPLADIAKEATQEDDVIVELSSFQLQGTETLRPHISIITNIYSAHLDYHGTQENYEHAKIKITENQMDTDYLVYNADQDELLEKILSHTRASLIPFSVSGKEQSGSYIKDQMIYYKGEAIISTDQILLPGQHNLENILAAIAGAKLMHCTDQAIRTSLRTFRGVPHRIEYVKSVGGRQYYNDSKATNAEATEIALKSFTQPVVLIAGGLDRHLSLDTLIPYIKHNVRGIVGIGETGEKIEQLAEKCEVDQIDLAQNMHEAVQKATEMSHAGDIILLSPAHASWDQYANFEERGKAFIHAVESL